MIITASLLLFISTVSGDEAQAGPEPTPREAEILVIGRQLNDFRVSVQVDDSGQMICDIKESSGDDAIDEIGCKATTSCLAETYESLAATRSTELSRRDRRRATRDYYQNVLTPCFNTRRQALIEQYLDEKALSNG